MGRLCGRLLNRIRAIREALDKPPHDFNIKWQLGRFIDDFEALVNEPSSQLDALIKEAAGGSSAAPPQETCGFLIDKHPKPFGIHCELPRGHQGEHSRDPFPIEAPARAEEPPTLEKRCDCGAALTMCADCAVSDYQSTHTECTTCCPASPKDETP